MTKDTDEDQPVSIEDEIESVLAAGEEEAKDDETTEATPETEAEPETDSEESAEESEEVEESEESEAGEVEEEAEEPEESEEIAAEQEETTEKLEAPEHWAAADRETFNKQTRESQEWLLKRHKEMEGAMTRKSQEFASDKRQYDAITDALNPYQAEFSAAGLDQAGAVRQLASWHNSLKTGGKEVILRLAEMYKIDMDEDDQDYDDPALSNIKQELSALKQQTAQQQQAAQQEQQNQLKRTIDDFVAETDETGSLKHPHFNTLYEDITKMFNAGMANDLSDAYKKALAFHPELTVHKPVSKPAIKEDQALKVKKAKKAAIGIKSSVATKVKRAEMTLEEEIAAQM